MESNQHTILGLLFGWLVLFQGILPAQALQVGRSHIGAYGHLSTTSSFELSGTLGETVIITDTFPGQSAGITYLTQGIQQPADDFTINISDEFTPGLSLFPNPVRDRAKLEVTSTQAERIHLELFDLRGRKVPIQSEAMNLTPGEKVSQELSLAELALGHYVLRLVNQQGVVRKQIRLVRAH